MMSLSPSGARIQGDDYQHLFAWYHALRALKSDEDVTGIAIEAESAGNVDDVVVRHSSIAAEHYQVKYSVSAAQPIDHAWWVTPTTKAGKSPLQRFWGSWKTLRRNGQKPHMALYTNRPLDVTDPLLTLRDGRHGRLGPRLRLEPPRSKAGRKRAEWAAHVGASEDELLEMLDQLDLLTDQGAWSTLCASTSDRMAAVGLQSTDLAVEQGVAAIRSWVTAGQREVSREMIAAEVARRGLRGGERRATVVVQAIDRDSWAEGATVSLDWVDLFEGDHPRDRRQLREPRLWNERLLPELEAAERRVHGLGFDRVLLRGYIRLPAWFAAGVAFSDTRGMRVACLQNGEHWGTEVVPTDVGITSSLPVENGTGGDLAVGLSVTPATADLSQDVLAYLHAAALPVRRFLHVSVASEPGTTARLDAGRAMGLAMAVKKLVQAHVRETGARKVHLFMSGPAGAALFLGHVWNRIPSTQLYEDLNPGYAPAFLIPG